MPIKVIEQYFEAPKITVTLLDNNEELIQKTYSLDNEWDIRCKNDFSDFDRKQLQNGLLRISVTGTKYNKEIVGENTLRLFIFPELGKIYKAVMQKAF